MIRLNLGSGSNLMPQSEGWTNVDLYGSPDVRCDLENTPWMQTIGMGVAPAEMYAPFWSESTVDEIQLNHVLEHLGQDTNTFIGIMKEIYRVCKPDAKVIINVPHPRSDNFINDPTHVRIITPELLALFSKKQCAEVKRLGGANTPLAEYHGIDLEIEYVQSVPDPRFEYVANRPEELQRLSRIYNNVVIEYRMVLRVKK